jgi:hypothetical protein
LADYYYTYFDNDNDSGWWVVRVCGGADNTVSAGAFTVYANGNSSTAFVNVGGRLCYQP